MLYISIESNLILDSGVYYNNRELLVVYKRYNDILYEVFPENHLRNLIKCQIILHSHNFILKKTLKKKLLSSSKKKLYQTLIFFKINKLYALIYTQRIQIEYLCQPAINYNDKYTIASSIYSLYEKLRLNNKILNTINIDTSSLLKFGNDPVCINQNYNYNQLEEELQNYLFQKYNIYNPKIHRIEDFFNFISHEIINSKNIINNNTFFKILKYAPHFLKNFLYRSFYKRYIFNKKYNFHKKKIQYLVKILQTETYILNYSLLIKNINIVLYFSYFRDFRGRYYPYSTIHPMYNKCLRHILYIKSDTNECNFEKSLRKSIFFNQILDLTPRQLILKTFPNIQSDVDLYIISCILLDLGKINKKKLLKQNSISLFLQDFVTEGIRVFENSFKNDLVKKSILSPEDTIITHKCIAEIEYYLLNTK
jgi:hypothetical protein